MVVMIITGRDISGLSRALACCAALCLSACAQQADLGRYNQNSWNDLVTHITGDGSESGSLPDTPAEEYLRIKAKAISTEPSAATPGLVTRLSQKFDDAAPVAPSLIYYTNLRQAHPTSLVSLVNTIGDDVRIDTVRLSQFTNMGDEVNSADTIRAEGLIGAPSAATTIASEEPAAFRSARTRISENGQVIDSVFKTMEARLVSYRTALAHARLDGAGSVDMDVVAVAILRLDDEVTRLDHVNTRHQEIQNSLMSGPKT
ncbi:MAG: hypothetical protein ACOH12_05450 [Parvibaculaceae bacterium]